MEIPKTERSIHFSDYYFILLKHKTLIIAALVITVTLTMIFTFLMKPIYRATATMVIDKAKTTSPLTGERIDYESYVSESLTFNTHFKLITSDQILEQVIDNLHFDPTAVENPLQAGFLTEFAADIKKNIRLFLGLDEKSLTAQEKLTQLAEKLREKVDIEEVRDTRLLKVNVDDPDPVMAMKIANELAAVYIRHETTSRLKSSQNTLAGMAEHLYEIQKKLEDAEKQFLDYKQDRELFSVEGKQKVISQKIAEFNDAYLETRNKRLEMDAKLTELNRYYNSKQNILQARFLIDNPLIDNLYQQLVDAKVERTRLGKAYKDKHPKIILLQSKIDETEKKLDEEIKKDVENLKVEQSIYHAKELSLQKTISDFENDALDTSRKEVQYNILKRNVQTHQKLYDTLLSKIEEADIVDNINVSNIRIAGKAKAPLDPIKPRKKLNLILSVIFGLMTGIGFAFLAEYLDRSIHSAEDIKNYIGIPVLSVVPVADEGQLKLMDTPHTGVQKSGAEKIKPVLRAGVL
jgi:succinoglycan biosynthesis transport protein ExoP